MEIPWKILLILIQFFGEVLLQIFGEVLIGWVGRSITRLLGFRTAGDSINAASQPHPVVAALGYGLLGGMVGGLTLLVFPRDSLSAPPLRVINLFFAPVLVGLFVVMLGKRQPPAVEQSDRSRRHRPKNQNQTELYQFSCGFIFAFAIALVRLIWAS